MQEIERILEKVIQNVNTYVIIKILEIIWGLFNIFKRKNKQAKTHEVVVDYNEIEKNILEKGKGVNTLSINDVEFVIKEDPIFKALGVSIKNAYGVIEGIKIKITLPKYMLLDNLVDIKPEYVERISNTTKNLRNKYELITSRIALETANYLNSIKVRNEQYTQEEVLTNIKTYNVAFEFDNCSTFRCWLDDESVLYSEFEDKTYKVEFFNEKD